MTFGKWRRVALNDDGEKAMPKWAGLVGTVRAVCEKYPSCRRVVWDGKKSDHIIDIKFLKLTR